MCVCVCVGGGGGGGRGVLFYISSIAAPEVVHDMNGRLGSLVLYVRNREIPTANS